MTVFLLICENTCFIKFFLLYKKLITKYLIQMVPPLHMLGKYIAHKFLPNLMFLLHRTIIIEKLLNPRGCLKVTAGLLVN